MKKGLKTTPVKRFDILRNIFLKAVLSDVFVTRDFNGGPFIMNYGFKLLLNVYL